MSVFFQVKKLKVHHKTDLHFVIQTASFQACLLFKRVISLYSYYQLIGMEGSI